MPEATSAEELGRFFALQRRLLERLSTRVEPFEHGTAFFDEEYRDRHNSNFLLAEGRLEGVAAEPLLAAADRLLGNAGYPHREVVVNDERAGERLTPAFAGHGYLVERNILMAHRRPPDRVSDLAAEELPFADVRPLLLEIYRREPYSTSARIVHLFTDQHGKSERVIGARFFAARVEGELAGNCELYVDGLDAQVESVGTLEEFRGKGVARAVVWRAVEEARASGARHVFIVADDDDWPKDLYARLGFDRIGRTWQFIRWPEGTGPRGPTTP
jgi:ribosomal protein S18 acetylase RimI-like enzyme